MPRIPWIEEEKAEGLLAEIYAEARNRATIPGKVPDIVLTMSWQPNFLKAILDAAKLSFSDAALSRAQHEMIASYVSALNRCHY
jgi:hypothetical protein